jgi:hypothetical protein
VCDSGRPAPGDTAAFEFNQYRGSLRSGFEGIEERAIGDFRVRNRPNLRRIDQHAVNVEHVDARDVRIGAGLCSQYLVPCQGAQLSAEYFGCDSVGMDLRGNVPQDDREILKLLIEVTGE